MSRASMNARSPSSIVARTFRSSIRSASLRVSNRSCSSRLPLWYTPPIVARFLVEVQESGAEEEERRDHEARDERRDRQRLVARAAQEEEQAALREEDEDRQRRQRPERVDEVRAGESVGAEEREPEPDLLEREHRDDQAER